MEKKDKHAPIVIGMSLLAIVASVGVAVWTERHDNALDVVREFVGQTQEGIEIGYLCQARGYTVEFCKRDFEAHIRKANP